MKTPAFCPHCNEPVPPKSKACPHCGADESTGWSDHARAQNLDLPDTDFDYEEFIQNEFGSNSGRSHSRLEPKPKHISWFWWAIAVLLLILILLPLFKL